MDHALLVLAAVGVVLLWHRAAPIKPIHNWLVTRSNRLWEWMVVGRWRIWRIPAWPLWWFKGVIGCAECKSPYVGLIVGLIAGERWWSVAIGLATYVVVVLTEKPRG